jgi:hypothetical protein
MSPLRMRMIEDMILSGLAAGTQATYIDAVRRLAAHYRRSPDRLSEEEVRAYILHLRGVRPFIDVSAIEERRIG